MSLYFKVILFIAAAFFLQRFCHKQTDGFAIEKISSSLTYHPEWAAESKETPAHIASILSQPFTYLGKGAQSYVFESEDKKYVLKFFRHSHMRPPLWTSLGLPLPRRQKKIDTSWSKLNKDFRSYKIAFEELKEETGLIYLHLNKTDHLKQKVSILDKLGIRHELEIDEMEFLLQRKATLLYPQLKKWIDERDINQAKTGLSSLIELLALRFEKGIYDKDPDLNTNFGFCRNRAIQIDVGRFKKDPAMCDREVCHHSLIRITDHLKQWLDGCCPELSQYLQEQIRETAQNSL
jgi:hypothetical protein